MRLIRPRLVALAVLVAFTAAPLGAFAQTPSYATPGETIRGTISSVENLNHLFVSDDRGFTDDVTLRSGAAVISNGVRLEPGQRVTIQGTNGGSTFLASRIATDGRSSSSSVAYVAPVTYPVPAYYPVYYPAPVYYGYGPFAYGYGFGPRFSLSIGFGFHGGYGGHGGYHGGYYGGYHGGYHGGRR